MADHASRRAPLTQAEIETAVAMREAGRTMGQIALKLGCSVGSVSWALLRLGVDLHADRPLPEVPVEPVIRGRGRHVFRLYTQAEDQQLLALEAEGLNASQIGRRLGRRTNSIVGRLATLARRDARAERAQVAAP